MIFVATFRTIHHIFMRIVSAQANAIEDDDDKHNTQNFNNSINEWENETKYSSARLCVQAFFLCMLFMMISCRVENRLTSLRSNSNFCVQFISQLSGRSFSWCWISIDFRIKVNFLSCMLCRYCLGRTRSEMKKIFLNRKSEERREWEKGFILFCRLPSKSSEWKLFNLAVFHQLFFISHFLFYSALVFGAVHCGVDDDGVLCWMRKYCSIIETSHII